MSQLKKWKVNQIAETLGLSDKLAELNYQRYQALGTKDSLANTRQAIFTFDGRFILDLMHTVLLRSNMNILKKPFVFSLASMAY